MKDKIKNGLIIVLIALIVLFGIFGGKAVVKYQRNIDNLKYVNTSLKSQNMLLEAKIKNEQDKVKIKDRKIDSCMVVFKKKDKVIAGISADLDSALAKLNGITSDSSYIFLRTVAYDYPGALKYLFNALQIHYIHEDYLKARSSEKIIPVMTEQLNNCRLQFSERDSIELGLKGIIALKDQKLSNCEEINQNNDIIIKDTEKQREKEKHRKNFWRFSASVMTGVAILVSVFGL
jgi:hypothetical protein